MYYTIYHMVSVFFVHYFTLSLLLLLDQLQYASSLINMALTTTSGRTQCHVVEHCGQVLCCACMSCASHWVVSSARYARWLIAQYCEIDRLVHKATHWVGICGIELVLLACCQWVPVHRSSLYRHHSCCMQRDASSVPPGSAPADTFCVLRVNNQEVARSVDTGVLVDNRTYWQCFMVTSVVL